MAQVPVPEGLSSFPDHGGRSASHDAAKDVPAHLTESGSQLSGQEQPSGAASLCLSLLPQPKAGFGWSAVMDAARPFAGLALMGVIAPAATIYAAKAVKYSPMLTAAVVGLELALAYLAAPRRAAKGTGLPPRVDQRGLPV